MQAPRGKQFKINGNIVNDSSTIKVNLKRRLQYKSSALSPNVRPYKVAEAAKWIVDNGDLYREERAAFNDTWLQSSSNVFSVDGIQSLESVDNRTKTTNNNTHCTTQQTTDDEDHWSEDETEITAGVTDTMLTAPDLVTDNERQHILNVAPGEGNRPMSIFRDRYEELAYPGIFLGQKRPDNTNRLTDVHYSEICKSELRRSDRRAAMCVENIFFTTKKLQINEDFANPSTSCTKKVPSK